MITIRHIPGYSGIDHVGEELAQMARDEFEGRPQTLQSARAAIARAHKHARQMAHKNPSNFGVFRKSHPHIIAERK